jgi:hypothetical protein
MTTTILKSEITKALSNINDKSFLEALYKLVNHEAEKFDYELSEDEWKDVEGRKRNYKAGNVKGLTPAQVRKQVSKALSA